MTIRLIYGDQVSENKFRSDAIKVINDPHHFIIVNFYRGEIKERGGGHFSPLAAYDKQSDWFLLLDVARYKYPPVWVKTSDIYRAMKTRAKMTNCKSRGYLIIGTKH